MGYETARAALLNYVGTQFAISEPSVQIKYPNIEIDGLSSLAEFVAIDVLPVPRTRELFGATYPYMDAFIIFVNIFTKPDTGTGRAMELADTVNGIINETTISGYATDVAFAEDLGNINGWYQVSVRATASAYI